MAYPWYDSIWLSSYVQAKMYLAELDPAKLAEFERALSVFRIDSAFEPIGIDKFFDDDVLDRIRSTVASYTLAQMELHELADFGRLVVHDDPYFLELQRSVTRLVSDLVGEEVEPSYNFLSLYEGAASCALHMDAPIAKWTLDICVDQSRPWPIHFSKVVPWPEAWAPPASGSWEDAIREGEEFTDHLMSPGEAIIFGGSSQWHYRDPMPQATGNDFCTLLFFHFIPAGSGALSKPENWADIFDVPALGCLRG